MTLIFILVVTGVFFYRLGDHEYGAGFTVAGLSLIIGLTTIFVFHWGGWGYGAGQVALLAGMTWYNLRRQQKRGWK